MLSAACIAMVMGSAVLEEKAAEGLPYTLFQCAESPGLIPA